VISPEYGGVPEFLNQYGFAPGARNAHQEPNRRKAGAGPAGRPGGCSVFPLPLYPPLRLTLIGGGAIVRRLMEPGLNAPTPRTYRSRAVRRAEAQQAECAATAALNVLGQKWVLRIVRVLGERTQRFCELQDALGGANSATLSQRLKLLEDEGLIDRQLVSEMPPWVEYSLTDKGSDLRRAIVAIDRWADRWAARQ
jgi:DNA-binding HxlR family transcriptional regulator